MILRRLGIFVGYFDLNAAGQVAATSAVTLSDVLSGVANLVDRSLISADLDSRVARYRLLDISPSLVRITSLPDFLVAPLRSAAESEFVRSQLVKGLNVYLEQAFPK